MENSDDLINAMFEGHQEKLELEYDTARENFDIVFYVIGLIFMLLLIKMSGIRDRPLN